MLYHLNLFFVCVGTDRLSRFFCCIDARHAASGFWSFFSAISSPTDRRKEKPTGQAIQPSRHSTAPGAWPGVAGWIGWAQIAASPWVPGAKTKRSLGRGGRGRRPWSPPGGAGLFRSVTGGSRESSAPCHEIDSPAAPWSNARTRCLPALRPCATC